MLSLEQGVVGILAGGGSLPREVAEHVTARGGRVHVVTISDTVDVGLARYPITKADLGKVGTMVRALKDAGCKRIVIVGSVKRPDLGALIPDLGFILSLPAILRLVTAGGDDGMLTRVVRFFEGKGFEVVAPAAMAPELLAGEGALGRIAADPKQAADVAVGFEALRAMGPYDVGQAVVITNGRLEAVEGVEGTDAMLRRVAALRAQAGAAQVDRRGILVKRTKPGQELRIDLPAIGPGTVDNALKAGLAGIAVEASGVLAAERAELVRRADAGGIFVQGWKIERAEREGAGFGGWRTASLTGRSLDPTHITDAAKGADLLVALAAFGSCRGVVIDRSHVLAVACGESPEARIVGAGGIRQWGRRRWSRRSGVVVLANASDLQLGLARAAATAGLAALALLGNASPAPERAIAEAERLGLAVATLTPAKDAQHGRQ